MSGYRYDEIREKLIDRIEDLCRQLVPDGKPKGDYWIGRNPRRHDEHAGSFWVRIRKPAIGAWRDEAGVRGVDDGDVVKLISYCLGKDLKETRAWCLWWLGLSSRPAAGAAPVSEEERARQAQLRAERREREEREEAEKRALNARSALAMWLKADKLTPANFSGSLVDRYLLSRSIDLTAELIAHKRALPGALRLFPAHDYHTSDGEVIEGLPCMIALMSNPKGEGRAVHRTWLRPDGGGKAELPDGMGARKIWPAGWRGCVVRISKGDGGLTPEEAGRQGKRGPLVLTEGIEDALAVAIALPAYRVWAAGTLGNLGHVPILPCVSRVIVAADNDWTKPQAIAALDKALIALRAHGRPVAVARSPKGKDMNDLLKGEGA